MIKSVSQNKQLLYPTQDTKYKFKAYNSIEIMTDSELPFAYNNWNLTLQSTEVWNKTEYNRTALDHAPGKFQTSLMLLFNTLYIHNRKTNNLSTSFVHSI